MSYSKLHQMSKVVSNFGRLFSFCYSAGANQSKTEIQTCNLQTGQTISYECVKQFLLNWPNPKFDNNFDNRCQLEHSDYDMNHILKETL